MGSLPFYGAASRDSSRPCCPSNSNLLLVFFCCVFVILSRSSIPAAHRGVRTSLAPPAADPPPLSVLRNINPHEQLVNITQPEQIFLTMLCIPKSFTRESDRRTAANAWLSWLALLRQIPFPNRLVVFSDEESVRATVLKIFVRTTLVEFHSIATNDMGTPFLHDAIRKAAFLPHARYSHRHILFYSNNDIVFDSSMKDSVLKLATLTSPHGFLGIGLRCEITFRQSFKRTELQRVISRLQKECVMGPPYAIDFFIFNANLFIDMPPFLIGRGGFDQWMVHHALEKKAQVVDVTDASLALHLNHDMCHAGSLECDPSVILKTFDEEQKFLNRVEVEHNKKLYAESYELGLVTMSTHKLISGFADLRTLRMRAQHSVAPRRPLQATISLAYHLTFDRFTSLKMHLQRWDGPIVIGFYGVDSAIVETALRPLNLARIRRGQILISHVVVSGRFYSPYPVNLMRNVVLEAIQTTLVLLLDGDFIPSAGLFTKLSSSYDQYELESRSKALVVVPFNLRFNMRRVPESKPELVSAVEKKRVSFFDGDPRPHHTPVNYSHWLNTSTDYDIGYRYWFEPYAVFNMRTFPLFDNAFQFYGYDKVQYYVNLFRIGFGFKVLSQEFIVHLPHRRNGWEAAYADDNKAYIDQLSKAFLQDFF
jgi:Glycosyl-transferase for dystroglycan